MTAAAATPAVHSMRIVAREDAGGGLALLTLEPDADVLRSYTRAGQYVQVQADEVARGGYFVLAGDVIAKTWELLVRPGGEAADAILSVPDKGHVFTSKALGNGFPFEEARGRPLLIAATGSGIAAMRPVVAQRVREGDADCTEVLLGVRVRADIPLAGEIARWRSQGVCVTVCVSREQMLAEEAGVACGYVQDVARRTAGRRSRDGGMIFAAGVRPMIEGVRALAADLGVAEADVRTNY